MMNISEEQIEQIATELLLCISDDNSDNGKLANEAMELINDTSDNKVFHKIVLTKIRPSVFNERELQLQFDIMSVLASTYAQIGSLKGSDFNADLSKIFSANSLEKSFNTKMQLALCQFVIAFFAYEELEEKYPELMKLI